MTTWTMDQVRQARGLRAEARVDSTVVERARLDVLTATREKLARALNEMAHPFAIEVHPADLAFSEAEDEDQPWHIVVRAWWEPSTRTVEFRGGPQDGMLLEVERVGQPLLFPQFTPLVFDDATEPTEAMAPRSLRYDLIGWNEQAHHWVYEVR